MIFKADDLTQFIRRADKHFDREEPACWWRKSLYIFEHCAAMTDGRSLAVMGELKRGATFAIIHRDKLSALYQTLNLLPPGAAVNITAAGDFLLFNSEIVATHADAAPDVSNMFETTGNPDFSAPIGRDLVASALNIFEGVTSVLFTHATNGPVRITGGNLSFYFQPMRGAE